MRSFISDYFGFNKQQRNGLWVLILISFTLLVVRLAYPYFIKPEKIVIRNLPLIEQKLDSAYRASGRSGHKAGDSNPRTQNLFAFDPNTVSMEQLQQLGFREKTATTLLKFRSRGFVFKEKKDLQKVYGISDKFYATLAPYIVIQESAAPQLQITQEKNRGPAQPVKAKEAAKVELNSADSSALVSLNGIGPAYARRILKYRNILGGFIAIEQLKEVYGFTEELYDKVIPSVTVNAGLVRRIRINTDDFKTLNRHPYLSYELTKSICNSRRQGAVTAESLKELLKDDDLYRRLLPYLTFD